MDLGISKCATIGCPNKSKLQPLSLHHQDKPYVRLALHIHHLTLSTKECNPNKDVITTQLTI